MHKLTSADLATIQQLAKALPAVSAPVTRQLTGQQLIDMGITTHNGAPVDPLCSYTMTITKMVNMVKVLQDYARQHGAHNIHMVVEHLQHGRPVVTKYGAIQLNTQAAA